MRIRSFDSQPFVSTVHTNPLSVRTSSPSSTPFLSWINSNSVPPGAYSITIISDFSSTKLSKYAIMFGCFSIARMLISFIADFRSSFWSSSTVICLMTIKLLSALRLQRNTLLCVGCMCVCVCVVCVWCVCVVCVCGVCVCVEREIRIYDSYFICCPPRHINKQFSAHPKAPRPITLIFWYLSILRYVVSFPDQSQDSIWVGNETIYRQNLTNQFAISPRGPGKIELLNSGSYPTHNRETLGASHMKQKCIRCSVQLSLAEVGASVAP